MVLKSEWVDWKANPVTKFYLKQIFERRELYKEDLAEGQAGSTQERDLAIGRCQGIKDCLDYAINSFEYVEDEEEKQKDAN